jgi:hypothetical protein
LPPAGQHNASGLNLNQQNHFRSEVSNNENQLDGLDIPDTPTNKIVIFVQKLRNPHRNLA